jgi:thiamine phosphate synthase YjbQ (UPF0047 family)
VITILQYLLNKYFFIRKSARHNNTTFDNGAEHVGQIIYGSSVFIGCGDTDHRHVEAICRATKAA